MSRLTGGILGYSFHIGKFRAQRRFGAMQAVIEAKKKSQIGDGSSLGLERVSFTSEMLGQHVQSCICVLVLFSMPLVPVRCAYSLLNRALIPEFFFSG